MSLLQKIAKGSKKLRWKLPLLAGGLAFLGGCANDNVKILHRIVGENEQAVQRVEESDNPENLQAKGAPLQAKVLWENGKALAEKTDYGLREAIDNYIERNCIKEAGKKPLAIPLTGVLFRGAENYVRDNFFLVENDKDERDHGSISLEDMYSPLPTRRSRKSDEFRGLNRFLDMASLKYATLRLRSREREALFNLFVNVFKEEVPVIGNVAEKIYRGGKALQRTINETFRYENSDFIARIENRSVLGLDLRFRAGFRNAIVSGDFLGLEAEVGGNLMREDFDLGRRRSYMLTWTIPIGPKNKYRKKD